MEIPAVATGGLPATLDSRRSGPAGAVSGKSTPDAPERARTARGASFKADPKGLALGILKQELKAAMAARGGSPAQAPAYPESGPTAAGIVGEVLAAVERLLSQFPLRGSDVGDAARMDAERSVDVVRDIMDTDDVDEIDDVLEALRDGIDDLEEDAARNVSSRAFVLSAESEQSERSTVRIRTQDGDVVVLDLRRSEAFSYAALDTDALSFERVEASAQSRLSFSVRGELDDAEMEAIRAVFEQAEAVATEFFGGDMAKAFESASALSFNADELAGVRLKFRQLETSRIEAALSTTRPLASDKPVLAEASAAAAPVADGGSDSSRPGRAVADSDASGPAQPVSSETTSRGTEARVDDFLEQLSAFLRDTLRGFESPDGQRYFFTESFKFSLLKSALSVASPKAEPTATERANAVIDAVSEPVSEDDS